MKRVNEFKAGLFVLTALVLFTASIFVMGRERQLFSRQEEFKVIFKDVKGLAVGATVRLGGITVGRVSDIGFVPQPGDNRIAVSFLINEKYLDRVRGDAIASLETQGLLGDKFLNLDGGKALGILAPGGTIIGRDEGDLTDVLARANQIVDQTVSLTSSVNEVVEKIRTDSLPRFHQSLETLVQITEEIKGGSGTLHELIFSKELGDNIKAAARDFASISKEIKSGKGPVHEIIFQKDGKATVDSIKSVIADLGATARNINELTAQVRSEKSPLHKLFYGDDKSNFDSILSKLETTSNNLQRASDALANGSGTLGALLVDPSLYDNLVEVTEGAKRSFLLRQAIKSSLQR